MTADLEPQRTSLDVEEIRSQLITWLQGKVSDGNAMISDFRRPSGSGMSSETLLFSATWETEQGQQHSNLVARLAPTDQDIPVFPSYNLSLQVEAMRLVETQTKIPVPRTLWLEEATNVLGVPFFVMEQIIGRVPADIPPYVFGGWLLDAEKEERSALERSAVNIIAEISQINLSEIDTSFLEFETTGETPLERHFSNQMNYYSWVVGDQRQHPVIEAATVWLKNNWPDESETVLSWGDARIGNIMFGMNTFQPTAVLDWEMAGLAPVEVDLGWMIFLQKCEKKIAEEFELEGKAKKKKKEKEEKDVKERKGKKKEELLRREIYVGMHWVVVGFILRIIGINS